MITPDPAAAALVRGIRRGMGPCCGIKLKQMLCGNKPEETEFGTMSFWNSLVSFYRGRVEIVIAKLKKHAWCKTAFRGSYI